MNESTTREEAIRIAEHNRELRRQAELRNERAAAEIERLRAELARVRSTIAGELEEMANWANGLFHPEIHVRRWAEAVRAGEPIR